MHLDIIILKTMGTMEISNTKVLKSEFRNKNKIKKNKFIKKVKKFLYDVTPIGDKQQKLF
jgi:D-mannonate dehydratase